jgi:hypothetical protein
MEAGLNRFPIKPSVMAIDRCADARARLLYVARSLNAVPICAGVNTQ